MRCNPVFDNVASCAEVPDAIGWSSKYNVRGSVVVECKASRTDFYRDKTKVVRWRWPESMHDQVYDGSRVRKMSRKQAEVRGLIETKLPRMGVYRFYLCERGIITPEMVAGHAPDHGLLIVTGRQIRVARAAPRRADGDVDLMSEVRLLRFAIINQKPNRSEACA
jgi:hypothetical protein